MSGVGCQLAYFCFMDFLKTLFHRYVSASIHVSLALVCLLGYTELRSGHTVGGAYYGLLFFGSIAGYNAIKALAVPKGYTYADFWVRFVPGLSVPSLLAGLYFMTWLPVRTVVLLSLGAGIALFYALPLLPGKKSLRHFGSGKVFWVALVWTLVTLWIPFWGHMAWGMEWMLQSVQRMLLVGLLMLPFEVRDMGRDPQDLQTFPRRWGLPATRRYGWVGCVVFLALMGLREAPLAAEWGSGALMAVLAGLGIQYSRVDRGAFYASFWVEAIPIAGYLALWGLLKLQGL